MNGLGAAFAFLFTVIIILAAAVALISTLWLTSDVYRQGQIDALTGNIQYELVMQADSTRIWQKKGGE